MGYERVRVDRRFAAGNTPTQGVARRRIVQAKLRVGAADDALEREADAIAAKVLHRLAVAPAPTAADTVPTGAVSHPGDRVQRSAAAVAAAAPGHGLSGGEAEPEVARRVEGSAGGGRALDADVQDRMQRAFGADFSGVRVHDDPAADELSRSLNARAFTAGSDIYFGAGQYRPSSSAGQELLAHELTHTLQQGSSRVQRSTAPASEVSTDHSRAVRRWDLKAGVDIGRATKIRTIESGQAVFMLNDGSGEEIVVKGEDYPIGLIKLATLVHKSVHEVDIIDSDALDQAQKDKLKAKIADNTVTSDPSWAALGAKPEWKKWNKTGIDDAEHARQMHQEQIHGLPLQVQAFAKGADAKAQVKDKSPTGFRSMAQSPKYMRQLGAAHAADLFTGNADRLGTQVVNLGNWMADTNERIQLIDNMDNNARQSFENKKSGDNIFGPDMQEWGKNPGAYYATVIDRLLQEARDKGGDATIVDWATGDGGFVRKFMIDDFEMGFQQTITKIVSLYGTNKKSKSGRSVKQQVKSVSNEGYLDYWEVLKARARYLQNPKKAAALAATVKKRQTSIDKKTAKKSGKK